MIEPAVVLQKIVIGMHSAVHAYFILIYIPQTRGA